MYAKKTGRLQERLDVYWIVHNFVRVHFTTRQVPAVALGILDHGFALHENLHDSKSGINAERRLSYTKRNQRPAATIPYKLSGPFRAATKPDKLSEQGNSRAQSTRMVFTPWNSRHNLGTHTILDSSCNPLVSPSRPWPRLSQTLWLLTVYLPAPTRTSAHRRWHGICPPHGSVGSMPPGSACRLQGLPRPPGHPDAQGVWGCQHSCERRGAEGVQEGGLASQLA